MLMVSFFFDLWIYPIGDNVANMSFSHGVFYWGLFEFVFPVWCILLGAFVGMCMEYKSIESSGYRYGNYQLAGHGGVTNGKCGTYHSVGCLRTDLHNIMSNKLSGESHKDEVYIQRVPHSCNRPSCARCYPFWASREGKVIEFRLKEACKKVAESGLAYPEVEHLIVAPAPVLWGNPYPELRDLAFEAVRSRGGVGGVYIFHAFRFNKIIRRWIFSPHWHALIILLEKYKCRGCKKVCFSSCDGFERLTRELGKRDHFVVKIPSAWEKRKSIYSTAKYQLSHSSIDVSKKRFRVAVWQGICSYRKLKISPEAKKAFKESLKRVCPLCKHELVGVRYFGSDARFFGNSFPLKGLWMDAFENGEAVFFEDTRPVFRKGER